MFGVGVPIETARSALALNGNNGVVPSIHTYRSAFLIGTAPHSVFCLLLPLLLSFILQSLPKSSQTAFSRYLCINITLSDNCISFCISTRMFFLKSSVFCLLAASSIAFLASSQSKQVDFPLPDSLPDPSPSQIESIQKRAGGTLPNTPPPMRISSDGINNLKLMAFTGLSEVAFFDELFRNITSNVPGYQIANAQERDMVLKSLTTLLAVSNCFMESFH